jgi:type IV pilus assembly protein PilV
VSCRNLSLKNDEDAVFRQLKRTLGNCEGGFSLIEGLLAATILAIVVLSLAGMHMFSWGRNVDANETTRVTNFAADIVERIQFNRRNAISYHGIDTNVACTINGANQPMARGDCDQWRTLLTGGFAAGIGGLRGQVVVAAVGPAIPPLNQNRVVVTMTWTGAEGAGKSARPRQMVITTVVAPE